MESKNEEMTHQPEQEEKTGIEMPREIVLVKEGKPVMSADGHDAIFYAVRRGNEGKAFEKRRDIVDIGETEFTGISHRAFMPDPEEVSEFMTVEYRGAEYVCGSNIPIRAGKLTERADRVAADAIESIEKVSRNLEVMNNIILREGCMDDADCGSADEAAVREACRAVQVACLSGRQAATKLRALRTGSYLIREEGWSSMEQGRERLEYLDSLLPFFSSGKILRDRQDD